MCVFNRFVSASICLVTLFALCATAADIVDVEGGKPATVGMDDVVRITGTGIAGAEISAQVAGAGKLDATNNVRKIKDGQPVIGSSIKEFMIKPTKKGTIEVTVTVTNPTAAKPMQTKYQIEVK